MCFGSVFGVMKIFYLYVLSLTFLLLLLMFCEYGMYFIYLSRCSWPNVLQTQTHNSSYVINAMILADIHLVGIKKGYWLDKLLREWQMRRAFQTAVMLHKPEIVFILGDILDEGSFSPDNLYESYVKTFYTLFAVPSETRLFIIAGNHDIGFHYAMHPYLEYRFEKFFNTSSSVSLVTIKNVHFILVNSMAMERDKCQFCDKAEQNIDYISNRLRCTNGSIKCNKRMKLSKYSAPILMQHFPLYRESDVDCNEFDEAPWKEKHNKFKENWDCLSKESTEFLLNKVAPRVVFSGHTHHGCLTIHNGHIEEYSVSSFNWRNKHNPSFVQAVFTPDGYAVYKCFIPDEYVMVAIYVFGLALITSYTFYMSCHYQKSKSSMKKIKLM